MNNVSQPKRMASVANLDTTGERHNSIGDSIPAPQLKFTRKDWLVALGLVVITVATRLPYIPPIITHSDGAEYAFALEKFDMARGYPHAPGYPYFILCAKPIYALTGDANISLVAVAMGFSALACGALYLLGTALFGPWVGLAAALLLMTDSNFWRFGVSWMSYPAGVFWTSVVALAAYRTRCVGSRWSTLCALVIGVAGGFRQQILTFFTPMWLWFSRRAGWRRLISGLVIIALLTVIWIVWVSTWTGGYAVYQASSQAQFSEVVYPGSVFAALTEGPHAAIDRSVERMGRWSDLLFGGHSHLSVLAWLLPLLYALGHVLRPTLIWSDDRVHLLIAWLLPIMAFHLLVNIDTRSYVLIYMPALCLLAGLGIYLFCADLLELLPDGRHWQLPVCIMVVVVLGTMLNAGVFALRTQPENARHTRQVESVISHIEIHYQSSEVAIVQSDARMFYHAVHYYLPEYRGYLLQQTMSPPRPSLAFPSPVRLADSVTSVIFLNPKARVRPEPELVALPTGATVGVVQVGSEQRHMYFDATGVWFTPDPYWE